MVFWPGPTLICYCDPSRLLSDPFSSNLITLSRSENHGFRILVFVLSGFKFEPHLLTLHRVSVVETYFSLEAIESESQNFSINVFPFGIQLINVVKVLLPANRLYLI